MLTIPERRFPNRLRATSVCGEPTPQDVICAPLERTASASVPTLRCYSAINRSAVAKKSEHRRVGTVAEVRSEAHRGTTPPTLPNGNVFAKTL